MTRWVLLLYIGCSIHQPDMHFATVEDCRIAGAKARTMMRSEPDRPFSWGCVEALEEAE